MTYERETVVERTTPAAGTTVVTSRSPLGMIGAVVVAIVLIVLAVMFFNGAFNGGGGGGATADIDVPAVDVDVPAVTVTPDGQ